MMISNWIKPYGLYGLHNKKSALKGLTLTMLKYFCVNQEDQSFFQKFFWNYHKCLTSFEYLCYESMTIINVLLFQCRDQL